MTFQDSIRQTHRWLGIVLTLAILGNFLAMAFGTLSSMSAPARAPLAFPSRFPG